jgi:mono/diheme cytochrome c family protein
MINNARPADLRQQRYFLLQDSFDFWRVSEGVPGTVMPIWKLAMSDEDRWLVALYVKHAYMDMVPHYTDEGDLPAAYNLPNPTTPKPSTSPTQSGQASQEDIVAGKTLYTANCAACHGYSGWGDGPSAVGTPLYPGLLPMPPNFSDTATYEGWAWGDFYWRISESIPLRPMMPWKEMFPGPDGSPGSTARWYMADYVRSMLMFPNEKNEPDGSDTPPKYDSVKMPADADAVNGRLVYFKRCWLCHGAGGQGEGQKGQNLRPVPANFTDADVAKMTDGRWFWRVSQGVKNAAMPVWHVLLSDSDEWDAIAYIKTTYVFPGVAAKSHGLTVQYDQLRQARKLDDEGNVEFEALTSPYDQTPEAMAGGQVVYTTYCAECHGAKFLGDGEFGKKLTPKPTDLTSPATKAKPLDYWYRMTAEGKPGTAMANYRMFIADREVWEVVWWTRQAVGIKEPPAP